MGRTPSFRSVVVEDSFDISGRGTAVVFRGTAEGFRAGRVLLVDIDRGDGRSFKAQATIELVLRYRRADEERSALLVIGRPKSEIPPGSLIRVPLHEGKAYDTLSGTVAEFGVLSIRQPWTRELPPGDNPAERLHGQAARGHPLHRVSAVALARRVDRDDFLFATEFEECPLAVVHLAHAPVNEPDWPTASFYNGVPDWLERGYARDVEAWNDVEVGLVVPGEHHD